MHLTTFCSFDHLPSTIFPSIHSILPAPRLRTQCSFVTALSHPQGQTRGIKFSFENTGDLIHQNSVQD